MNTSDLHSHTSTTTTSYSSKPGLLSSNSGGSGGLATVTSAANSRFDFVILSKLDKDGNLNLLHTKPLSVEILNQVPDSVIVFSEDKKNSLFKYTISREVEYARLGANKVIINTNTESISIQFSKDSEKNEFISKLADIRNGKRHSLFDQRTDETSAVQYFQFYSLLSQQQNMMQDYVRTATYQKAIFDNAVDFEGKIVLDVGAGSGILSFFAAQAGAAKVYAVEASSMAQHAAALVKHNNMQNKIKVISGKVEDIELPEKVDVIISEPMGYALLNERMLESFLFAKKWLKPNGKMYPTLGDLYVAPFTDEALYMEQAAKANFWSQNSFYGIDLTVLKPLAFDEYFKQPVVDTFDPRIILATPVKHSINFLNSGESDLYNIEVPLKYDVQAASIVHGLAFWFDVAFNGSSVQTWLSTSPTQPLTHWYQVRCLFPQPFLVTRTAQLVGKVQLKSNKKQSYDVNIMLTVEGSSQVFTNNLDLKNPYFRYNGQVSVPAGHFHESPTEYYLNTIAAMTNQHAATYQQQHGHQHSQYHQQPQSQSSQSGSGSGASSGHTNGSGASGGGGGGSSSSSSGTVTSSGNGGSSTSSSGTSGYTQVSGSSSTAPVSSYSHSGVHSHAHTHATHAHVHVSHVAQSHTQATPSQGSSQSKEGKHQSEQ